MIDVGGAALLGAAARNAAGVAAVGEPGPLPAAHRRAPRARPRVSRSSRAQLAAEAFGTVAAYHAEIAAYLNQISGNMFPPRLAIVLEKVDDLRYGENPHQRAAFYRETTHRSGTLADATQLQRRAAVVQQPAGPRRRLPDRVATTRPRPSRSSSTPTRSGSPRTTSSSRPTGRRSRPTRSRRSAASSASTASSTGRRRERSPPTHTRRSSRPGYSQAALGILQAKAGLEILAVPPDPTEGMRDYGIANLDFKRVAGGLLVESLDELGPRPRPAPGRHQAPPDARGADRSPLRLAGRPPRPLERDRPRPQRGDGRDRGRPGEPPGLGRDRPPAGRRPGEDRGHGERRLLPVPRRDPAGRAAPA